MAEPDIKRVTLEDVARLTGVSSQTVSRVVNGHPYVSDVTRRRVQDAIRKLGYRPNRAARSLATQRTCMLGIVTFGIDHYGPAQMVTHVEQTARARGYGVTLSTVRVLTPHEIRVAIDALGGSVVDGLVLITPVTGLSGADMTALCANIPFVQIDTELGAKVPSVVIDQRFGSRLATQYLIDLGHRALCEISGPLNWYGARARHESWVKTLRQAGLTPGPSVEGDWTAASGFCAANRLLDEGAVFSGLVVGNDQMALGAIRALRGRGLRVPEDVSVVGFDDIPEAAYFEPPLTTVWQNFAALGEQSVEYLVSLIDNPHTPVHQRVLHPQLVERQSACLPRQGAFSLEGETSPPRRREETD
jgi:LacI family transcriptional regulator